MLTIPSDAPKGKAQIGFSSGPFWHIMIPFKLERCLTFDVSGWKFSYCGAGQYESKRVGTVKNWITTHNSEKGPGHIRIVFSLGLFLHLLL
jgi:hypothetical protein